MLRTLFIPLLCLLGTTRALAWGPKGHDVVAYIAECNLTPEAAEKIDKILGGASMVYWANWLEPHAGVCLYRDLALCQCR